MSKGYWDSLAPCFEQSVMQVAEHDLDSTLKDEIRRVAKGRRLAADLGCGVGSLLPLLCRSFSTVYAVDYSPALLQEAKNRVTSPNIQFIQHNLAGDKSMPWVADVTFCVNALVTSRPTHRRKIGLSVFNATKKTGFALIVVPSLESVFHTYHTIVRCNVKYGYEHHQSLRSVNRLFKIRDLSPAGGIVNIGGRATKCFMREEIMTFLTDIVFKVTKIQRVQYPWHEEMTDAPTWLEGPYPWDWLVTARRPN